ncbi:NAD(P)/FAD-dependent oxidoreductase [Paraburkholderia sp. A3BS-1L]|uniref:NAD(P)/FAD-dependent oxidoreductase n=1 Tax=Paraburkholderia sp. A3BS-1L TaxID=3028375 RepID=UPI003DA9809A
MPSHEPVASLGEAAVVIGGGIVGVCCALYLQRAGYVVTLIDPEEPGNSTAKWSCGQMAVSEIIPLSKPGILMKIPGWLMDQKGPLALRPSALPGIVPWFVRFLMCARHSKIVDIAQSMATLTRDVYEDYAPLLDACGDKALMGERPILEVFDDPSGIAHEQPHLELRESLGFKSQRLNAKDIGDLEPALAGKFAHGLLFPDWRAVSDTMGFIAALTESFIAQGGRRVRTEVTRIDESNGRATGVTLENGERVAARHVVIAAGTGSRRFFGALGVSVPLEGIAGYQAVVKNPGVEIRHSTIYADGGFCFSPMTRGLQIGGTIEFAGHGSKPNFKRADIILEKAKRVLPELQTSNVEYGVGYRPFLPDTKPIIDRSRRLPNVFMAFGHGQLGLTLGATTGRLIADMVAGRPTKQNLVPFSAYRFS